jgi:hypothetical protein
MKRGFEFELKLNQVPMHLIHIHYKMKNYRLHISVYSEN